MLLIIEISILILVSLVLFWLATMLFVAIFTSPSVYANNQAIIDSLKLAGLKKGELLLDLGCGDARSLIIGAKKFGAEGIGFEISPYCYIIANIKVLLSGERRKVKIIFGDFKKAEGYLKKADVVYLYHLNATLVKIEEWLFEKIGNKTRTVSLAFVFPNKKPVKTAKTFNLGKNTTIRLYKK